MLLGDAIDDLVDYGEDAPTKPTAGSGEKKAFGTFDDFLKAMHATQGITR